MIRYDQFEAVQMIAGTITRAELFEQARKPAYKVWIDFGELLGIRQSSAQITDLYTVDDLIGRQVVAVVNLHPKRIAGFMSEVLTLGVNNVNGNVVLLQPMQPVPNGSRVY